MFQIICVCVCGGGGGGGGRADAKVTADLWQSHLCALQSLCLVESHIEFVLRLLLVGPSPGGPACTDVARVLVLVGQGPRRLLLCVRVGEVFWVVLVLLVHRLTLEGNAFRHGHPLQVGVVRVRKPVCISHGATPRSGVAQSDWRKRIGVGRTVKKTVTEEHSGGGGGGLMPPRPTD